MALLAALMTMWVRNAAGIIATRIFVDDRPLWMAVRKGRQAMRDAIDTLDAFVRRAGEVEAALGWQLHPDKGEWSSSTAAGMAALREWSARPGKVSKRINILGVVYNMARASSAPVAAVKNEVMRRRLKRIRIATPTAGRRSRLAKTLVQPMIAWKGAWERPSKAYLRCMATATETAVAGYIVSARSRLLRWGTWDAALHPAYALDRAVLRQVAWRGRMGMQDRPEDPQLQRICKVWGWTYRGSGVFDLWKP